VGFGGRGVGLGLGVGLVLALVVGLVFGLVFGLILALVLALGFGLRTGQRFKRSAVSSHLTFVLPSSRQQLLDFLRRAVRGLVYGLGLGLVFGLILALILALGYGLGFGLVFGTADGLGFGLLLGLILALGYGLLETRSVLITSRTPKEARSRSLIAALTWLVCGLLGGLVGRLIWDLVFVGPVEELALRLHRETVPLKLVEELHRAPTGSVLVGLVEGLVLGLVVGLVVGMRNGGWFVLLQKAAHRRLARDGNLPPRPYDFLEWGIERQLFRRVGGGVRFRHNLIQQHLANTSEGVA
jgi:hypothetical protein